MLRKPSFLAPLAGATLRVDQLLGENAPGFAQVSSHGSASPGSVMPLDGSKHLRVGGDTL